MSYRSLVIKSILVFLVVFAIAAAMIEHETQGNLFRERQKANLFLSGTAYTVERQVFRSLSTAYALAAILQQTGGIIHNFDKLAAEMLTYYGGIGSLTLMPNGINTQMHPLAGNESAIGHNILQDPSRRAEALAAISSRQLMLAGPYPLKQGGVGAIGRLAVFLEDPQGNEHFWGFVAVVLNLPELLEVAHLGDLTKAGYEYELSKWISDTGQREIFSRSSPNPLSSPEIVLIDVPNGKWELAVSPKGGWTGRINFPLYWAVALLVAFFSGLLTYGRLRLKLQKERERRREEIESIEFEKNRQALQASEARYRALMEQSFEALAVVDIEKQEVVEANRRFTELLGYSLPEDAPLNISKYMTDSKSHVDKMYNTTLRQQRFLPPESKVYRHKNGTEVHGERAGTVITLDGRDYLLSSIRDLTAERRRQEELTHDAQLAGGVQRELLPVLPDSSFASIRTLFHPSKVVSGDSYYLEWRNEGKLLRGFLIDVSGHGLGTAIQTSSFNVLLREASIAQLPLIEQVNWLNAKAAKYFTDGAYAAMIGFELDFVLRELRYVGAGITQFYASGRKIEAPGMFVGMWADAEFETGVLPVEEGDCLHFLTDGFTDALAQPENADFWSPDGKDFDSDMAALERLAESGRLRDDATGVCLKIKVLL